ncbi:MAG: peptide-methionine (S)-S-oxide reductase MsrA [Nitrospiraceae bacterium]
MAKWIRRPTTLVAMGILAFAAVAAGSADGANLEKAVFAGGCFWCMEEAFEGVAGVVSVTSGYMGGTKVNPTYEEVSSGSTGHAEAVEVLFDSSKTGYRKLLDIFWRNIDPTTPDRQFCDRGSQYRSAIFPLTETQQRQAEESRQAIEQTKPFREQIVTQIAPATTFYPAEDYHQDFYKRNPIRYKFYKYNCGRVKRLEEVWGKPQD